MTKKAIECYLKTFHKLLHIPILYSDKKGNIKHFDSFLLTGEEQTEPFISNRLKEIFSMHENSMVMYFVHKSMVMLGIVRNPKNNEFVFLGPMASVSSTDKDISDYLFASGLSAVATKKIAAYLNATKIWTLDNLKNMLINVNTVLNNTTIKKEEITVIYDEEYKQKSSFVNKEFKKIVEKNEVTDTILVEEYNAKLNYCVVNGDIDGLADLLNNMRAVPYRESVETSLREHKINAFGSVFAAETIALKSGIPQASLETIKQYYLSRIDECQAVTRIYQLTLSALYEFTKAVKEHLSQKTENPTIMRAINYIKANITSKLVAKDIAEALHTNEHYLFTKFKKETGVTLNVFINREKIKKACYFLLFTDKTLVEIATYLSFSSQNYFQTVFKQVTGKTPTEWRKNSSYVQKRPQ